MKKSGRQIQNLAKIASLVLAKIAMNIRKKNEVGVEIQALEGLKTALIKGLDNLNLQLTKRKIVRKQLITIPKREA